jgi:DNA processing protein
MAVMRNQGKMEEKRMLSVCEKGCLQEAWVWLSCLPNIRNFGKRVLMGRFPDVMTFFGADRACLQLAGIDHPRVVDTLLAACHRERAVDIVESTRQLGIDIIYPGHPEFPGLLDPIPDSPIVLYRRGTWTSQRCVAVVGSRRATGYGIGMAQRLSADLADAGFAIVSGLARGIDTAAHTGALQAGGRTIAVMGSGVETIYPPENRKLAERILDKGAFLSEYPPGTPPVPFHFPVRNRIVSGLSEAVLVVEAGERSGSLITVQCALEQGRDVFAIPGNATSLTSRGCNRLIREGAGLVQESLDILESLTINRFSELYGVASNGAAGQCAAGQGAAGQGAAGQGAAGQGTAGSGRKTGKTGWHAGRSGYAGHAGARSDEPLEIPEQIVFGRLAYEPLSPDQICAQSGLSAPEVQQVLLMLELKHYIAKDADGRIRLIP